MTDDERLTAEDIDQIIEGIEEFCIGPGNHDPELDAAWRPYIVKLNTLREETNAAAQALDALSDMVYQFGYDGVKDGQPSIHTGGLSALEHAFEVLGWDDPYVIPDPVWCDAPVTPRCPNRTTCGTPTPEGYKRFCHDHFALWQQQANLAAK